jgi:hypothetical protein
MNNTVTCIHESNCKNVQKENFYISIIMHMHLKRVINLNKQVSEVFKTTDQNKKQKFTTSSYV